MAVREGGPRIDVNVTKFIGTKRYGAPEMLTLNCSCVGKLFSHSLQSLVPIRILCTGVYAHGHETLQGMGK